MTRTRPRLAFISPVFLFPNDAGGKIRTTNILRGMKGGAFDITLVSVVSSEQRLKWAAEIDGVCDTFIGWEPAAPKPKWRRSLDLLHTLPVNIVSDRTAAGLEAIARITARTDIDLFVFDFLHAAVLRPHSIRCPSICFTHNVEAEIFARHAKRATNPLMRKMWSLQYQKMHEFERTELQRFDTVIAVSERDAVAFRNAYDIKSVCAIPTGVDLDFFAYQAPPDVTAAVPPTVVFTGSMDWAANIDGVQFFLREVWPLVLADCKDARFVMVGRNPPASLQTLVRESRQVQLTGFVDDIRPYVHAAHVFVIPLLVGGGTRIKAFEAMAMGCPVVSTSIGIEGLDATEEVDYLRRDGATSIAAGILELFQNGELRSKLAENARRLVEERFGHRVAAQAFEQICLQTLEKCDSPKNNVSGM